MESEAAETRGDRAEPRVVTLEAFSIAVPLRNFDLGPYTLRVGAEKIEKSTRSAISLQRGRVWASLTRQIVANGLRYTCEYACGGVRGWRACQFLSGVQLQI